MEDYVSIQESQSFNLASPIGECIMKLWKLPFYILTKKKCQAYDKLSTEASLSISKLLAENLTLEEAVEELRRRLPVKRRELHWQTLADKAQQRLVNAKAPTIGAVKQKD